MLQESINEKNKVLYEKLKSAGVEISFEIDPNVTVWYVQQKFSFKIASPNDIPNPAAMAHELFHVALNLKGFWEGFSVYKLFNERNSLFDPESIGILNNSLAHFKMIDDFLQMGFHVDEFLQDTPKQYFLEGIVFQIPKMILKHKTGLADICLETLEIIQLCASLKLFELYKIKYISINHIRKYYQ